MTVGLVVSFTISLETSLMLFFIASTSFLDDSFRKNLESALRFGNPLLVQVSQLWCAQFRSSTIWSMLIVELTAC